MKITSAKAADMMRAGGTLQQMKTKHGPKWYIVPTTRGGDGGEITEEVAVELIERPDVQPGGDGLFPGISQTFRLWKRRDD